METEKITKILQAHASGDRRALNQLMPLVYDELKRMAQNRLIGERSDHTLSSTELVHEAYLKLIDFDRIDWQNRYHFFGIASQIMRNILVDYAVRKRVSLGEADAITDVKLHDILSIHHALKKLEKLDERQVRVVECRFFGGLTIDETAKTLDISTPTVSRDWKMAKAWLNRELSMSHNEE
jgi:RNA polymerase sigma factor (TIGR02999 family)